MDTTSISEMERQEQETRAVTPVAGDVWRIRRSNPDAAPFIGIVSYDQSTDTALVWDYARDGRLWWPGFGPEGQTPRPLHSVQRRLSKYWRRYA